MTSIVKTLYRSALCDTCICFQWDGSQKGVIGMTIEQVSQRILNQFIVPASWLMLIAVVFGIKARGAEFIINQFQRSNITTQEFWEKEEEK